MGLAALHSVWCCLQTCLSLFWCSWWCTCCPPSMLLVCLKRSGELSSFQAEASTRDRSPMPCMGRDADDIIYFTYPQQEQQYMLLLPMHTGACCTRQMWTRVSGAYKSASCMIGCRDDSGLCCLTHQPSGCSLCTGPLLRLRRRPSAASTRQRTVTWSVKRWRRHSPPPAHQAGECACLNVPCKCSRCRDCLVRC